MANAGMEFTDRPTFRLIPGIPQPSNAIKIASKLGINHGVIENALKRLDKKKLSVDQLFRDLSKELQEVRIERNRLKRLTSEYETKLRALNAKKKKELDALKAKYKKQLIQSKRSIEHLIKELKQHGPEPERVHKMRAFFNAELKNEQKYSPYYPAVGELVYIRGLKRTGQVVEQKAGRFKISLENIYYWVGPEELKSIKEERSGQED